MTVKRVKERLRKLTQRSRSQSMEHRLQALNQYVKGWLGYYGLAEMPCVFAELDQFVCLGVPKKTARQMASTRKGLWRAAGSPPVHQALNNAYCRDQGLVSLSERHQQLCSIS